MDGDRIVLDRASFKALAVDSRISILKLLDERPHTLTELAAELELSHGTVKEHLEVLESSGLIIKNDEGRKWKYYDLTDKGRMLVNPRGARVFFSFMFSLIATMILGISMMVRSFLSVSQEAAITRMEAASDTLMMVAEESPRAFVPDALFLTFIVMLIATIVLFIMSLRAESNKIA